MFGFGKIKSSRRARHRLECRQGGRTQAVRQGLQGHRGRHRAGSRPTAIVDGAIIDGGAVAEAIRRVFERKAFKTKDVAASLSGQRGHRQEDQPAGHDRGGTLRVDLLGSRTVHPLRHPGRQSRLPDSRRRAPAPTRRAPWTSCWWRRRRKRSPTTPASSPRPGCVPVVVDVDAFALQNACEANYGLSAGTVVVLHQRRRQRGQHQHPERRSVALHARHLARRQRLHRSRAARAQSAVRERGARQEGAAGRGRHVRRCAAGAARDDRERAARDSEDLRLLQGHRRLRPDRPHLPQRRRRVGSTASRTRSKSGSTRRSRCSIPSRRSRATPSKLGDRRHPATDVDGARWPWVSRSGRRATGDSRQPAAASARRVKKKFAVRPRPASSPSRAAFILVARRCSSAGATGALDKRVEEARRRHRRPRSRKRRGCIRSSRRCSSSSSARRSCSSASALIEQLRKDQTGPVHMLDQISRALPPMLWLTEMKQNRRRRTRS